MADENTTPPAGTDDALGGDDGLDDEPDPRHRADQQRRQKLQTELAEHKAWKAERETADRKADEERARKAGDFEKVIGTKDTKIRDLQEKLDAANTAIEDAATSGRRNVFLDAVLEGSGVTNRRMAALALPTLGLADDAPEDFTELDARKARKKLLKAVPELFGTGSSSEPKPPPGGGKKTAEQGSKEHYQQLAANMSNPVMSAAYERATGRGNTS